MAKAQKKQSNGKPKRATGRTSVRKIKKTNDLQLEFVWRDELALRADLERISGLKIHLTVTDNTRNILSVKRDVTGKGVRVRLHHMFLAADCRVVEALAAWLMTDRRAHPARLVDEFIQAHAHSIRSQALEVPDLATRGNVFDLAAIFERLNAQYFENTVTARVTWGKMPPARRRRSIRFGSYTPCDNVIRIHPLLDQTFIPMFFIRYIMFHEMLHAYVGVEEGPKGRRRYHTPEFNAQERLFPDYARAVEWQGTRGNLNRLLTSR